MASKKTPLNRLASAAYHEAGHAVMCQLMGLRIRSVSIGRNGFFAGRTIHKNPFQNKGDTFEAVWTVRDRLKTERAIMVCLAGPLAQRKYAAADGDAGDAVDSETALALAVRFFRSKSTAVAYLAFAETWIRQMFDLRPIWDSVERLAHALELEKKITGARAEQIIGGASSFSAARTLRKRRLSVR